MEPGDYVCSSERGIRELSPMYFLENNLVLAAAVVNNAIYLVEVDRTGDILSKRYIISYCDTKVINNIEEMIGKVYVRWYSAAFLKKIDMLNIYLPEDIMISKAIPAKLDMNFIHNNKEYLITELSFDKKIAYAEAK